MLRYYPSSRTKKNQITSGGEFQLNGKDYSGVYYETFDGECYTGSDPITGTNQLLIRTNSYLSSPLLSNSNLPIGVKRQFAIQSNATALNQKEPIPYYPKPVDTDYIKGYIIRYFTKKINNNGYVIEISEAGYNDIVNGTAQFDISMYQTTNILWKISGPLHTIRLSQYDTREGIIETNKRLTESANPNFFGIVDFINGEYSKFAKPTM